MLLQCVQNAEDDPEKVRHILESDAPSIHDLRRCLWAACRRGKPKAAAVLIAHGADVTFSNSYARTLLMVAAYEGFAPDHKRLQLAQLLVQKGVETATKDADNKTALHYAVQFDRQALAVWLAGLYDQHDLSDAFLEAVKNNNVPMARKMLMCGANINYRAANGVQAVVIATLREACEMLAFLTHNGADVNVAVATGATALHLASRLSVVTLSLVLQKGGDVTACTNQSNTALHYAVDSTKLENVRLLLRYGSDPNAENERGETPLLLACRKRQDVDIILALLNHGADPNRYDEGMSFPLNQLVMQPTFNHFRAVDLLQAYGARMNPDIGAHPLALLCSMDATVPYDLIVGLILRGACLRASGWFDYITHPPTLLKLGVWSMVQKRAAVAFYYTFVYGEEKGVRPVPVPRRLTGAYGLYPIRRRLAGYLVQRRSSVRYMIQEIVAQF